METKKAPQIPYGISDFGIAEYSRNDRTEFIHTVQETQVAQQSADISKKRRHL